MSQLHVIVGGQFGSEGKGAFVGALYSRPSFRWPEQAPWVSIRVAGPNAGHTIYSLNNDKVVVRSVPAAAAVSTDLLLVAPGSEVDEEVLYKELAMLDGMGFQASRRFYVHNQATVLLPEYADAEGGNDGPMQKRIGSTGKGVGMARAERIMRRAPIVADIPDFPYAVSPSGYRNLVYGNNVLIEGTQGYGLGLHAGYYPFCTSSDCTAGSFVEMAGLSPWDYDPTVWLVCRTFPIRVAGNSGLLWNETSWDQLNVESDGYIRPEFTTVTKKMRRVARFDANLVRQAVQANGPAHTRIALMFMDYVDPSVAGITDPMVLTQKALTFISMVQSETGGQVWYAGTGPSTGVWLR